MCAQRHQSRRQRHDARDVRARVYICQAAALIEDESEEPIHMQHPCPHPRVPCHGELCHLNQAQAKKRKEDPRQGAPNRCVCVCVDGRCSPFPPPSPRRFLPWRSGWVAVAPSPCLFSLPALCGCWLSVVTVRRRREKE
ncbi:hypothetical protein PTSG_13101 [Salpingoeca rosetta]|uniref:Uncharacterized protein n=1 Tax=Salpingoeca rosetta (strain ATCC 50818 / BSB-021) TaxID=946362 RepID=F2URG4_SALR5|nr:uncharacterized protein PTSG_13101 [Salpingoeca rosetta]EGD80133.1 hypothetical protein PTSG_13101 [Salpingoeca rosetta]|eukprot:XP_004988195.1 hypothetical protein PTSG_13101 [Salpingoeca rosetta]